MKQLWIIMYKKSEYPIRGLVLNLFYNQLSTYILRIHLNII